MKIVQINATCAKGSTGKICVSISRMLTEKNIENYIFYAAGSSDDPVGIRYMNPYEIKFQALKSRIFGNYGFNSAGATKRLLKHLDRIQPDIVHLHNLHHHNCDLKALFRYFKEKKIKIFWTFHDCWAFTGYCPHFDMIGCDRWKTACRRCPQRKHYSWFWDRSHSLFEQKKALYKDLDLTVITPSQWLADQVKESFLQEYPVRVIHNGIDLEIFKPTESDFRKKYGLEDRKIILGVAFGWNKKKGLDVFLELSRRLKEPYKIVLIGTNKALDQELPAQILSLHRTHDQRELAGIYSAADLMVNPTREDTFATVNLESIACGTPVVTFDTGGCREAITETCGAVVPKNDVDSMEKEIVRLIESGSSLKENCLERAKQFNMYDRFEEYVQLYEVESEL